MITVLYFGWARDCAGIVSERIETTDPLSVSRLWDILIERRPRLAECRSSSRMAVDMNYADDADLVPDGSEVALIPPVAGG
jgi:molybdopterin converting factor subunit 1